MSELLIAESIIHSVKCAFGDAFAKFAVGGGESSFQSCAQNLLVYWLYLAWLSWFWIYLLYAHGSCFFVWLSLHDQDVATYTNH